MTKECRTICNGCGKVKGEANRWWCVSAGGHSFKLWQSGRMIECYGRDVIGQAENIEDYCGEQCVLKRVQDFLAEAK